MELFKTAFRSLWRKRVRSLLTMGGIVVGVSLVSIVTVIGTIGKTTVNDELESMGLGGLSVTASGEAVLQEEELRVLRAMEAVASAVPLMVDTSTVALRSGASQQLMLCGIDSGEVQAIGLELLCGRLLETGDIGGCARVCVVDEAVAKAMYARTNVVGRTVSIPVGGTQEDFTVVGVTRADSALFQNVTKYIPAMVYIPYSTMQTLTGRDDFDQVAVRLIEGANEEQQAARIESTLKAVRGASGYAAENLSAQKDKLSGLMDIVTMILTAISAISLLVSGLSIMTIMMVSVGERTREIGIKKALGATSGVILKEFLAEALLLSLGGGVIGVMLGAGVGVVGLSLFGVALPSFSFAGWLIVVAVLVGIAFGVYPAAKAACLDPVEALRCE
ncbi:MAG: ABC transporter permease [Clostridia bacterium]|nr:ABC transporter permease [Clostridia bacterium]